MSESREFGPEEREGSERNPEKLNATTVESPTDTTTIKGLNLGDVYWLMYLKKQEQKLAMYEADSAVWNVMNVIAKNQSFNLPLIRNVCVPANFADSPLRVTAIITLIVI